MDLWVVAAAAGAGYLAKYLNRVSKNGDSSGHMLLEDSIFENPVSPSHPYQFAKQAGRNELGKDVFADGKALEGKSSDLNSMDGLFTGERVSTRGITSEKMLHFRNYDKHDVLSISNLAMSLSPYDGNFKDVDDGNDQSSGVVGDHGFLLPGSSVELASFHNSSGHKTFLRMKHLSGNVNRPLSSLESCFMAQLYKEHAETEEFVFSSVSSRSMATRSFFVSNGSQIINRANINQQKEAGHVMDENVFGVPSLPNIRSVNDAKKMKFNAVIGRSRRRSSSDNMSSGKLSHTQQYDKAFLFSLGISFGTITCIMANKREIDKLRELLKQTENLVQDLQEELEMKDSMTVKELQNENYEEGSESMSKIEAELEAELERLGLDMNASSLEKKLSELVELEPEFVADFAQGELRADMVSGEDSDHPNEDASDPTPLPANYAVLPHELSLRLHEVVQSQLEERVKELESALENSQRKVLLLESKQEGYLQKSSSFSRENDDSDLMSQPLILNLSGEALDAYNEAYEELIKINDSEENSPLDILGSDHEEGSHSHDWHAIGVQSGESNGSSKVTLLDGTEDESCDFDNEVEQQLIRQIVERTKKGSPLFKNAQKILYSMDDEQ
uniref:Uncharacterized protein n=1 Tax=Cajanus cajan TaxID=3821 RepID=A0A151RTD4_CAJCA|nr:hypothetical protein KK1_032622 [Cajanus cajan]